MEAGLIERLPEVAPPVLKFVPMPEVEPDGQVQVSVVEPPEYIVVKLALIIVPPPDFASEQEEVFDPPFRPLHPQVKKVEPLTLLTLVPAIQE